MASFWIAATLGLLLAHVNRTLALANGGARVYFDGMANKTTPKATSADTNVRVATSTRDRLVHEVCTPFGITVDRAIQFLLDNAARHEGGTVGAYTASLLANSDAAKA